MPRGCFPETGLGKDPFMCGIDMIVPKFKGMIVNWQVNTEWKFYKWEEDPIVKSSNWGEISYRLGLF